MFFRNDQAFPLFRTSFISMTWRKYRSALAVLHIKNCVQMVQNAIGKLCSIILQIIREAGPSLPLQK